MTEISVCRRTMSPSPTHERASTHRYWTIAIMNRLQEPVTLDHQLNGRQLPTDELSARRRRLRRPRSGPTGREALSDLRQRNRPGEPPTAPIRIYGEGVLGLPEDIAACLFDLDGVLTPTAKVHRAAWEETFNAALRHRSERTGEPFVPFDPGADYHRYVDGRPRFDGVRSFLASRGITLPDGPPDDTSLTTVHGIGNAKNEILLRQLREKGVEPYPGSLAYLQAAAAAGLRRAVVSASANCREVVAAAGLADLLEVRVDGVIAKDRGLRGKPHPDTFLAAAEQLGVDPARAAVFEDALAGVEAGRAGGFGVVVGVDRVGQTEELLRHGADIVVRDLAELLSADPATAAERSQTDEGRAR